MFRLSINQWNLLLRGAAALVPLCLVLGLAAPAGAQVWVLKVSEKEMQLAHPNDMGLIVWWGEKSREARRYTPVS